MMTSAPSYSEGGGYASPVSAPIAISTAALPPSDSTDDVDANSLRLVKRSLHYTTSAAESCKKRRKQSTPIRISTEPTSPSDDNANNELSFNVGGLLCEGKLGLFLSPSDQQENSSSVATSPIQIESETIPPIDKHSFLPHVKIEPLLSAECDRTNKCDTNSSNNGSPVNLSGNQNYSSWISDMQMKTDDWLGASTQAVSSMNAMYLSVPVSNTHTGVSQQIRSGQQPIRIFNPEAYCELCNKEFCNKYFLKTHKANKHRIYSEPTTSSETVGLAVNVPSFTSIKKPIASMPIDLPKNATDTMNKLNTNSNAITPTGFLHTTYCEICSKGFANKVFLKAHKISVHGIIMPESQESNPEIIDSDRSLSLVTLHKDETENELNTTPINPVNNDKENSSFKSETFKDDSVFSPEDENSQIGVSNCQLNIQQQQSRESVDFSSNRLRRLGILNPEAFCEICCKEYCNKYFLRTHKIKRHGILIPDDNTKDINQKDFKLELSISNNWYQTQTSPLNLIMGEQNTNSSGSYSERKSSPVNENECEICNMRFQTSYLAQLHAATAHNISSQSKISASTNNNVNSDQQELDSSTTPILTGNNNEKQAGDSISEDLQKLQTMILQLNELDVSRINTTHTGNTPGNTPCVCTMCGKDYENRYYLHAHLMTEHGILLENNPMNQIAEKQVLLSENGKNGTEMTSCKFCGRDGFLAENIQLHIAECSGKTIPVSASNSVGAVSIKKEDSNGFITPEKSTVRVTSATGGNNSVNAERRSSITLTPTNSYCEICNKELCNKYFMKTHMQRMHGIEIENGAQIGGVVCNICNKELCSKYFLRVHKHNTHGIVEENSGNIAPRQNNLELDPQSSTNTDVPGPVSNDSALKPADLSDLSNRYFTHFTEVCTICSRRFRSTKWLKAHLLGDHGKAGTEKWNELEIQLQQSFNQQQQVLRTKLNQGTNDRVSPTIRVPNGGSDNLKSEGNMQKILHSIFGADETNVKQYHCSFCTFSTPVLAFLFVHERSHAQNRSLSSACDVDIMGSTANSIAPTPVCGNEQTSNSGTKVVNSTANITSDTTSPLNCAACNQSFQQPDQLHHHIITQHSFLSLNSFYNNHNNIVRQQSSFLQTVDDRTDIASDNVLADHQKNSSFKNENQLHQEQQDLSEQSILKCTQCGVTRKQNSPMQCDDISTDITITLKDLTKQHQLPASYALPQNQQQRMKYMMQAFFLDELNSMENNKDDSIENATKSGIETTATLSTEVSIKTITSDDQKRNSSGGKSDFSSKNTDRRFAPSIVFLPVLEKLTAPLTVSFTLTPA